jgi:hypothetical protein
VKASNQQKSAVTACRPFRGPKGSEYRRIDFSRCEARNPLLPHYISKPHERSASFHKHDSTISTVRGLSAARPSSIQETDFNDQELMESRLVDLMAGK